ncbi:MAG TPA: SIS domain-containing protein [Methylocella sp.]|nr:SIS domain-containing protein [Methylocella sp.]
MSQDDALKDLYPFLHGRAPGARALSAALDESVRQKVRHHQEILAGFFAKNCEPVISTARTIAEVYRRGGRLFSMGNGGSSCDAAHVAVEFIHPITAGRPALTAVNLACDTATMTAVGNDVGFDNIFVRQIIALGRPGDGLIGISTSGNSTNLIKAFKMAKEMGLRTIGLAGNTGGEMAKAGLDHCLIVETDSIHRVQECHVTIYHILWDLVHTLLSDERGRLSFQAAG